MNAILWNVELFGPYEVEFVEDLAARFVLHDDAVGSTRERGGGVVHDAPDCTP